MNCDIPYTDEAMSRLAEQRSEGMPAFSLAVVGSLDGAGPTLIRRPHGPHEIDALPSS
jgi:hypothetical protein